MARQLSNEREIELQAARDPASVRCCYKVLLSLVVAAITTPILAQRGGSVLAQNGGRGNAGPPIRAISGAPGGSAGRVLYARVYRRNTFERFGHAFSYERPVPGIAFRTAYYAWATRRWSAPVSYRWGWDTEPWHRAFSNAFTPYQNYASLDEWLTDYVVAQNLRCAYESRPAENAPDSSPEVKKPPEAMSNNPNPDASHAEQRPYWDEPDDGRRPYWEESFDRDPPARSEDSRQKHDSRSHTRAPPQSRPRAKDSPPPLSGEVKAALNAQIKLQLAERQSPRTAVSDDLPDSLKPGHTLFRVNSSLNVPAKVSGEYCSLGANDYIERVGDMDENGMVAVKVKAGRVSDCGVGLTTNVSVNDLEAMESEQQQALTDALLAASKHMGKQGLPQAPATTPMLLAAGQTHPAPAAPRRLSQLQ